MSKTYQRKNKKGAANYWLYQQLHQQKDLGSLYYLNYAFLIGFGAFLFVFLFCWIPWMKTPTLVMGIALGLIETACIFKAMCEFNLEEFGRAFVLFEVKSYKHHKRPGITCAIQWITCLFPLAFYLLCGLRV
ncbi:MAG: hypothetical protein J6M34_08040 [Clostridia bacterium]|nr:hypothetical protein [Clostridia bacterium]